MSAPRPITVVIKELRQVAAELRVAHTIDDKWPESERDAQFEYFRILAACDRAEKEFRDLRDKELRLNEIENMPEVMNG